MKKILLILILLMCLFSAYALPSTPNLEYLFNNSAKDSSSNGITLTQGVNITYGDRDWETNTLIILILIEFFS